MGLKIAMISPFFVRCGIYTYTMNLSKALADLGCEIFGIRLPRFGIKTSEILQNVVDSIPVDKVDLIHVQHEYGLYQNLEGGFYGALKRLGKPLVTTCHSVGNFVIDHIITDASDRVIVHNEWCARHFEGPSVIIPHGCLQPVNTPPVDECKKALGIDPKAPLVGYCGFISPTKGIDILIEAMTKVPEAGLLIGGGWFVGDETSYIMDLRQKSFKVLPSRCQWLGYVSDEQLPTVYGAMDIVVYPSRYVSESGALLMALSHGKAVIASQLPPVVEKEKLGALITFKDVEDLCEKIKLLLKDDEFRLKLKEGARNYARSVEWCPNIAEKYISLYQDVIHKHVIS